MVNYSYSRSKLWYYGTLMYYGKLWYYEKYYGIMENTMVLWKKTTVQYRKLWNFDLRRKRKMVENQKL